MTFTLHKSQFTVLALCTPELQLTSVPLLQMQVAKRGREFIYYSPLLRHNNMATCLGSLHVMIVAVLPHVTVERRHFGM